MSEKLLHDSTKTFKPIIFQFLVALDKCFEMMNDESIWIERYGDVTSSAGEQIEVKDYKDNLTNLDHNIWKTLKNWLDDKFNISYYSSFILLTTQDLSDKTLFNEWNKKNKEDRLIILEKIARNFNKQSQDTKKLLNTVLNKKSKDKLLNILNKFTIDSSTLNDNALYKKLIETRSDGILSTNKQNYINALFGYIINPTITSSGWEITNKEFRQKTTSLIEEYSSTTKIFPKRHLTQNATNDEEEEYQEYTFVKKIEDINYHDVKSEAISDFIYARKIIAEELNSYMIPKEHYKAYEKDIHSSYHSKFRTASRNTDTTRLQNDSKNLYDDVTGEQSPNFRDFNDTPRRFKNGLLHEMADDDSFENKKKILWKLRIEDE